MSTENSFIPDNYEPPTGGGGFTKLEAGDNRFRILSSPLMLWSVWLDGKASRVPYTEPKPVKGSGQKDSVKHAWALIVWNYKTESIEVFELDKQEVIANLVAYAKNPKWGHPKQYDIVINKSGSGMDTEYKLVVEPKEDVSDVIIKAYTEHPIDLGQLLVEGGNPFIGNGGAPSSTAPAAKASKTVTPDNWVEGDEIPNGYTVKDGKLKKKTPF